MSYRFEIIDKSKINTVIPLVSKLNEGHITEAVLSERFSEMIEQNYECAVIYDVNKLIGVCGLWYSTRHYIGKTVEVDHVYIDPEYRGQGLGKLFFKWIYDYALKKGCLASELNTYVQNFPSHKFYYNEGYEIFGYHFVKSL